MADRTDVAKLWTNRLSAPDHDQGRRLRRPRQDVTTVNPLAATTGKDAVMAEFGASQLAPMFAQGTWLDPKADGDVVERTCNYPAGGMLDAGMRDGEEERMNDPIGGKLLTETFDYDGGRQVTVYVPPSAPEAVVFSADGGWHTSRLSAALESANALPTMIVGIHGMPDDDGRLKEYVSGFDPERFAAHEKFFVEDVRRWVQSRFGVALPPERTAVWGASLGGELALAMGLRHPDIYGAIFCASPGAGYKPTGEWPSSIPRTYLVAGTEEQFFLDNATRWADALREAGADVVMTERVGSHGGAFWGEEFPLMVAWAFSDVRA